MKPERPKIDPKHWGLYKANVLVTGGSGTWGHAFADSDLSCWLPKTVRIFSRDEFKQAQMRDRYSGIRANFRWIIGDVRDAQALRAAMTDVHVIVHAAALKRVDIAEYSPVEAVQTNINGSMNVVRQAVELGVPKLLAISSDKAVQPANLYGATKMTMERLMIQGNVYARSGSTRISCLRYGNVSGSRGSVLGAWRDQLRNHGRIWVRNGEATRFWMTPDQVIRFAAESVTAMNGGEIFVPKAPSVEIGRMAFIFASIAGCEIVDTGQQRGEKLHEQLISPMEVAHELDDRYVLYSDFAFWTADHHDGAEALPQGFEYRSDTNHWRLSDDELTAIIEPYTHSGG